MNRGQRGWDDVNETVQGPSWAWFGIAFPFSPLPLHRQPERGADTKLGRGSNGRGKRLEAPSDQCLKKNNGGHSYIQATDLGPGGGGLFVQVVRS